MGKRELTLKMSMHFPVCFNISLDILLYPLALPEGNFSRSCSSSVKVYREQTSFSNLVGWNVGWFWLKMWSSSAIDVLNWSGVGWGVMIG